MGKYLPIIVPVTAALFILIFGYLYIRAGRAPVSKSFATVPKSGSSALTAGPAEVPKNLPDQTRIENLEAGISSLLEQLNGLKSAIAAASPETQGAASTDYRLKVLETSVLDLKGKVETLEKPSPAPSVSKPPLYIPLGTGSQSGDQNWVSIPTYQVELNPSDYPGITNAVLEVNMKLILLSGTGYARLYNATDKSAVSGEVSTVSDKYAWFSTPSFSLASGKKTYQLQLKSSNGTEIAVQNARIKINFQ